jgi:arylsulfatase A
MSSFMNASGSSTRPPNIILINCDDLGYGDLGCYGSEINTTPALDRMAAEGMRFTDFYMASSVCSPSRGAMLTGCYPRRIGFGSFDGRGVLFPGQEVGLHPEEITFAELLRREGYATKIVGKWHCGDQPEFLPTRHGFESYYGLPYSNDMGRQAARDGKAPPEYPPLPLMRDEEVIQQQPDQAGLTERYVEESVRFIRENCSKPFLLYLAHMHVHLPIYAPERFLKESKNGRYGAAVECIDWATNVLLSELRRLAIDEQTLVVFTSDNGSRARNEGGSNAPLRGTKCTTWEGGMRVPCIMRWPGKIPAGTVCPEMATAMDFYPTFARLANAPLPDDRMIDGRDILPLMLGEPDARSPHEAFFYYYTNTLEAVRSGKWKLHVIKDCKETRQLYDLQSDPGETTNLAGKHPDVEAHLLAQLEACRADLGDAATDSPGTNLRPLGRVKSPDTLTHFDPEHPYICALYDLPERG